MIAIDCLTNKEKTTKHRHEKQEIWRQKVTAMRNRSESSV